MKSFSCPLPGPSRHVASVFLATGVFLLTLNSQRTAGVGASSSFASRSPPPAPPPPARLIVKFTPPFAQEIEGGLAVPTMRLQQPSTRLQGWLKDYRLQTLRPLYPADLREKIQSGRSGLQMAENARDNFPWRSLRASKNFQPPDILRTYVIEAPGLSRLQMRAELERLRADTNVEFAQLDQVVRIQFTPNDPYFNAGGTWGQPYGDLYGTTNIACPAAWGSANGTGVVVAVVDTGIDYRHADITNQVWTNNKGEHGWDFVGTNYLNPQPGNDPMDHFGHGTHVAGTIAAEGNNGIGVIGVAWGAKVMAVKVFDDNGYSFDSAIADGIIYAATNGADIINASWGAGASSPAIEEAIAYAASLGVVFVAAAGNSSADVAQFYPANDANAIVVSASTPSNSIAYFSNFGYGLDVAAPGVDVLSLRAAGTDLSGGFGDVYGDTNYVRLDGTSMAAPHVSGVAALILSLHPTYSPEEVRQVLRKSADRVLPADFDSYSNFDEYSGYGRINAARALALGPVLAARILSPAKEATVFGTTNIVGIAEGANFANFTLDYGLGDAPTKWTILKQSSSQQDHARLGTFKTGGVPDGRYTVRLRAFNSSGGVFEDHVQVNVANTTIANLRSPAFPSAATEYKAGVNLPITGTALSSNFKKFLVDWAACRFNPTNDGIIFDPTNCWAILKPTDGWRTNGLALTGGGAVQVTNRLLATWDTGVVTQACFAAVRLRMQANGFTNETRAVIYLEPDLYSTNWPLSVAAWANGAESLLPTRDSASNNWLMATCPDVFCYDWMGLWRLSLDGSSFTNFVLDQSFGNMALGRLDGISSGTVVPELNDVRIFQGGSSVPAAQPLPQEAVQFTYAQATLADLDGDGVPEILAWGAGTTADWLYAWKGDGRLFSTNFPMGPWPSGLFECLPLDIAGDGHQEILVALNDTNQSGFYLTLLRAAGRPANWRTQTIPGACITFIAGDLDGNGRPEIAMTYWDNYYDYQWLCAFAADGSMLPGWPVQLAYQEDPYDRLLVADLNRDGHNEIIVASDQLIDVFRADGSHFSGAWPVQGHFLTSPVVAGINGDGQAELLVADTENNWVTTAIIGHVEAGWYYTDAQLRAYRSDGTMSRSWELFGADGNQPCTGGNEVILGDFDGSGHVDVAVAYGLYPPQGSIYDDYSVGGELTVLRLQAPYRPNLRDWPVANHDAQNSATGFVPAQLRMADSDFRLSWPLQPYSPILQSSDELNPALWRTVTNYSIVLSNGMNTVALQSTNTHRFYRLEY